MAGRVELVPGLILYLGVGRSFLQHLVDEFPAGMRRLAKRIGLFGIECGPGAPANLNQVLNDGRDGVGYSGARISEQMGEEHDKCR